jgi:hypothetical protein
MDQQMEKTSLIAIATVCFGNLERSRQSGKTRRRRGEQENGPKKPNMTLQKIPQSCFLKRKNNRDCLKSLDVDSSGESQG